MTQQSFWVLCCATAAPVNMAIVEIDDDTGGPVTGETVNNRVDLLVDDTDKRAAVVKRRAVEEEANALS